VYFQDSVGGLAVGAPVTFRGVAIGSVSRVALLVDPVTLTARIPVYLQLEPDRVTLVENSPHHPMLRQLVEAGLRAKLVSQSLVTGQMQVDLDMSPETPARFVGPKDGDVPEIPAVQSDLQELRTQSRARRGYRRAGASYADGVRKARQSDRWRSRSTNGQRP
jgi:paraquat-inducible protein B